MFSKGEYDQSNKPKSPFSYQPQQTQLSPPPPPTPPQAQKLCVKLNASIGLNNNINSQFIATQTHHNVVPMAKQYQPHNMQYNNINTISNQKTNYQQHTIHQNAYSGVVNSIGSNGPTYTPFSIKNTLPQHIYRAHDNMMTIKPNEMKKQ
jgi:hypothetical protein